MDIVRSALLKLKRYAKTFVKKRLRKFSQKKQSAGNQNKNTTITFADIGVSKDEAFAYFSRCPNDIRELDFKGYKGWCRVLSVYDGDTMTVAIPLEGKPYKFSIRLEGIDTPEMKGESKADAIAARNRLIDLITGGGKNNFKMSLYLVWFECCGFDKYRRLLGKVYSAPNERDFSSVLIAENHGYAYFGGAKM